MSIETSSLIKRLLATLMVLAVYSIGRHIPLPFVAPEDVSLTGVIPQISILVLGALPWISAAIIIETVGFFIPVIRNSSAFEGKHVNFYGFWVMFLTLALAIPQAWGVMVALEGAQDLLSSNIGMLQKTALVTSIIAGTFATIVLARAIDHYGIRNGFWLIFGFGTFAALTGSMSSLFELSRSSGQAILPSLLADGGFLLIAAVLCCVIAHLLLKRGIDTPAPFLWPLLIAGQLIAWLYSGLAYLAPDFANTLLRMDGNLFQLFFDTVNLAILLPILWIGLNRNGLLSAFLPVIGVMAISHLGQYLFLTAWPVTHTPWYLQVSVSQWMALFTVLAIIALPYAKRQ